MAARVPGRGHGNWSSSVPSRRHLTTLALVVVGGFAGSALREAVAEAVPTPRDGFPSATLAVNLLGSLLLGFLVEVLARAGADAGRRRQLRLLAGTGFLGGFTTYSTFAVEADLLVRSGRPALALAYMLATVLGGLLLARVGIALGAGRTNWRATELPVDPEADTIEEVR